MTRWTLSKLEETIIVRIKRTHEELCDVELLEVWKVQVEYREKKKNGH